MCNSDDCRLKNLREYRRLLDAEYDLYGKSDRCWCGYIHFDDDGNVMNVCPSEDTEEEQSSVKGKWRDIR